MKWIYSLQSIGYSSFHYPMQLFLAIWMYEFLHFKCSFPHFCSFFYWLRKFRFVWFYLIFVVHLTLNICTTIFQRISCTESCHRIRLDSASNIHLFDKLMSVNQIILSFNWQINSLSIYFTFYIFVFAFVRFSFCISFCFFVLFLQYSFASSVYFIANEKKKKTK